MELNQETIEQLQLNEDQVKGLTGYYSDHISSIKKEYDGKANDNAEKILDGAANAISELTGVKREHGQKIADYIQQASNKYLESSKTELESKRLEIEDKLKNGKVDETLKNEYEELKSKHDKALQKAAQFDEWEKEGYKDKYENTQKEYLGLKQRLAFSSSKPNFPDNVNEYEAKAKWSEFEQNILAKYEIELDSNGEALAIDKDNEHRKVKLSDLVKADENITTLLKAQENKGFGGKPKDVIVEGLPFKISENMSSVDRQTAIRDYLASQSIPRTDPRYAPLFEKYNKIVLEKTPNK